MRDFYGVSSPIFRKDVVAIELKDEREGVHFEYQFLESRSYLEMMKCCSKGVKLTGLHIERKMQKLVFGKTNKSYDKLTTEERTFLEEDFNFLN